MIVCAICSCHNAEHVSDKFYSDCIICEPVLQVDCHIHSTSDSVTRFIVKYLSAIPFICSEKKKR
jgi:hypothetical protein